MEKKGWIRIVEAFIAIMLITSTLLIVINNNSIRNKNVSSKTYEAELLILREIEIDDNLRKDILSANLTEIYPLKESLPISWIEFDNPVLGLQNVKKRIINRIPNYLECEAKICRPDKICPLDKDIKKEVYAKSIIIAATLTQYGPRQLKLFCWTGENK